MTGSGFTAAWYVSVVALGNETLEHGKGDVSDCQDPMGDRQSSSPSRIFCPYRSSDRAGKQALLDDGVNAPVAIDYLRNAEIDSN